jgi:hypothetical protein
MHKKFHQNKIFIVQKIKKRPTVVIAAETKLVKKTLRCENSSSILTNETSRDLNIRIPNYMSNFYKVSSGCLSTHEDIINSSVSQSPRSMSMDENFE